jgi:hypothetical protein
MARETIAPRFQTACSSKRAIFRSVAPTPAKSPPEWMVTEAKQHNIFLPLLFPTLLEIFSTSLNALNGIFPVPA